MTTTKRTPSEARRVSTSFDGPDIELLLHVMAAVDLNDPQRVNALRQHPRSRALLERFQQMHAKATGRAPRNKSIGRRFGVKAMAVMAEIRAARGGRSRLPFGQRQVIARQFGISVGSVEALVTKVAKEDAVQAEAAE